MSRHTPVQLAYNSIEPNYCEKNKAPILFLHGLTASKEYWNDIPQAVAQDTKRKVYTLDSRNHGDSEWSKVWNLDCNVDDLLHFMDKMDITKAVLVGHSMGGLTAINTALRSPEKVEKLFLEDITIRKLPQSRLDLIISYFSLAKEALEQIPASMDEKAAKEWIGDFVYEKLPPETRKQTGRNSVDYRIQLKKTSDERYTFKLNIPVLEKALKNTDDLMTEPLGLYEGPTCIVYGKSSPYKVGEDEDHTRKFLPNAKFFGIENASHNVHLEYPKEFTETLLGFLREG